MWPVDWPPKWHANARKKLAELFLFRCLAVHQSLAPCRQTTGGLLAHPFNCGQFDRTVSADAPGQIGNLNGITVVCGL